VGSEIFLERLYKNSPQFRGPKALCQEAKSLGRTDISLKDCKDFLSSQPSYSLYRPSRQKYKRNKLLSHFAGHVVQIDIMDLPRFVNENDGYRYVLLGYDTYSKFLTSIPLKRRTTDALLAGIEYLRESSPFAIRSIYSDKESGFMSRVVQAWFISKEIHHYTTTSKVKAPGVERAIRSLRMALHRHFEASGSRRWIDVLPQIVDQYNDIKHSTTKQRPWDVVADDTLVIPHGHQAKERKKIPQVGSFVRVSRLRSPFEKEASGLWSREIFKVVKLKTRQPIPMLVLQDMTGGEIQGAFYPEEVQKIRWDGAKEVAEVFRTRKRQGVIESLVSFVGWPEQYREWLYLKN
jgi:hypothetical protein